VVFDQLSTQRQNSFFMAHKYTTLFKWINVVGDYILLNGTLYVAFIMVEHRPAWREAYDYKLTILLMNFCWSYSSSLFGIYNHFLNRKAAPMMTASFAALSIFLMLALIIKFTLPYLYIPPTIFVNCMTLFPALILVWRCSFLLFRDYRRQHWHDGANSIAIIGAGAAGIDFYNYVVANPQLDYFTAGVFDDDQAKVPANINYLGKVEDCLTYASANNISEIYCALPFQECERIEQLMQEADKHMLRFRLIPDIKGAIRHNFQVELIGFLPVLKPRQEPLENKANEVIKRIFDILFSSIVIVLVLSWLIPFLGLIIKIDSKGPIFFKQLRPGKKHKPFYCLKFRSMVLNGESDTLQACKNDYRITRVGRFIRKTSMDELPQFINVFWGDMSVVGPRPNMFIQTRDYSPIINNYMVRHFLTPGITGWAQVNGFRGETRELDAMLNRVQADLWYLENWSIFLDLKIILLTFWQVLKNNDNTF
jgi:putative colanic acid biosynthesis UDP-glucose lipid carrier transferase